MKVLEGRLSGVQVFYTWLCVSYMSLHTITWDLTDRGTSPLEFLILQVWEGAQECAFLVNSQILVRRPTLRITGLEFSLHFMTQKLGYLELAGEPLGNLWVKERQKYLHLQQKLSPSWETLQPLPE